MTHVLIPDYPTRVQFSIGASTTGPFAFNFTFFALSDIHVWQDSTELTPGQFNVFGNPGTEGGFAGGYITLGPLTNCLLTIMRIMPLERVSDFPDAGSFNRRTLNTTLDKHVAMIQQVDERIDRVMFIAPPGAPPSTLIASWFPRVNADATGMELISPTQVRTAIGAQLTDPTLTGLAALALPANFVVMSGATPDTFTGQPITNYAQSLIDDPDAATARTTLGLGTMATQNANAVAITGGTISGVAISVPGLGTMSTQNANAVAITGGTITGMPVPVNFQDVATKGYADNLAFGVNKRSTVRVATTANLTLASVGNGTVVDGVALVNGDRLLVKDQTNHAQNGVYLVGVLSTALRAADFDTYDECPGSLVTIQEGTINQDTVYLCTSNAGGVLDTTPIDFSKVKVSPTIPVSILEGGTGQTAALAAFNALKQPTSSIYAGVIQLATAADVISGIGPNTAVTPETLYPKISLALTQAFVRHDCSFQWIDGVTMRLSRVGGHLLTIDAVLRDIPVGGVDLIYSATWAPAGLGYVYASWTGTTIALTVSATGPVIDPRDGNHVLNGNPAGTWVGCVAFGAGQFWNVAGTRSFWSAWNQTDISLSFTMTNVQTVSLTPVNLALVQFLHPGINFVAMTAGYVSNNSINAYTVTDMAFNGTGASTAVVVHEYAPNACANCSLSRALTCNPGYTSLATVGYVSGGTGSWNGVLTVNYRG